MDGMPTKPQIYNRPWHLDLDDRRHHGARQWEREVLQSLIDLAAQVDSLYPPDWSEKDLVTLRGCGGLAFAKIHTDSPAFLSFAMARAGEREEAHALARLRSLLSCEQPDGAGSVVRVRTAAEVHSREFREWFHLSAESFRSARRP